VAYDLGKLSDLISSELSKNHHLKLATLANDLRLDRHTIERAIRLRTGNSFRNLQADTLFKNVHSMLRTLPTLSIKEIAPRTESQIYFSPVQLSDMALSVMARPPDNCYRELSDDTRQFAGYPTLTD